MKAIISKSSLLSLFAYIILSFTASITNQQVWSFQITSISKSPTRTAPLSLVSSEQVNQSSQTQYFVVRTGNSLTDLRHRTMLLELTAQNDDSESDDDGWNNGIDKIAIDARQIAKEPPCDSVQRPSFDSTQSTNISQPNEKSNRDDYFIPIFTLVSICGLLGAYGYEMIRLYLRGELYLPFLH